MSVFAGLMLVAGLCRAAEAASGAKTELPEVTVPVCPASPYLDGVLTDECWQAAAVISNFPVFKKPEETVAHKAYMIQDGQWLYIGMEILHPAPKHIKQTAFEPGGVFGDDSLEIFLDPGSSNAFYLHYGLNAANIKMDQIISRSGVRTTGAYTPWRSATRLTDTGWNAEMAFPLKVLTNYQKRSACDWTNARINICVNTIKPIFDLYGARMSEEKQSLSWSPVVGGFHEPERFGLLKGVKPDQSAVPLSPAAAPLFCPMLVNAQPGQYEIKAGQAGYSLKVTVTNAATGTGMVEVVALDRPVAGTSGEVRQNRAMGISKEEDVVLTVPLKTLGRRTAVVWLNDIARGGAFDSRLLDEEAMQVIDLFAAWLDRSYYTTEKEAQAVCRLRVSEASLAGRSVVVKDKAGRTVGRMERLTADGRAPIALDQFGIGQHALTIEWLGADGKPLAVQETELIKLAPRSGCEVKKDKVNGVVLKDGTPIFPFGLFAFGLTSKDEDYFRRMAEAGFNTLIWEHSIAESSNETGAWLAVAQKYGLMVVDWITGITPIQPFKSDLRKFYGKKVYDKQVFSKEEEMEIASADFDLLLPDLRRTWELGLQHPNLIGLYNVDESNLTNPDARVTVAERFYKELKKVDPYRPVLMLYACHIPSSARWTQWSEVLMYDPYIYPGWGRLSYGAPNFVTQQTIELKRRADSVHQAVWIALASFCFEPERTPRGLTAAEQNCQTYLALIHGAKGVLYFHNQVLYTQVGWDALSNLAQQMKVLGPAIVGNTVPQKTTYQPTPLDAEKDVFPEVQAALFQYPDGRYILLAANSATWPVTATFTISGFQEPGFWKRLQGASAVKDLFGDKTWQVQGNAFTDELEGYGVRAYMISLQPTVYSLQSTVPIQLTVLSQGHPEKGPAEQPFPMAEIQKRKNKMPNPSFEITTFPGVPDYIMPNMSLNWPLVGAPGAIWGIETNNPYHGKQCLRIANPFKGGKPTAWPGGIAGGVFYAPKTEKPMPYTFSFYARAERDGEKISLNFNGMTPRGPANKWKLTRDWKRYSFTGKLSGGGIVTGTRCIQMFNFLGNHRTWSKDSTVYIDALQIEEGEAATAFTLE